MNSATSYRHLDEICRQLDYFKSSSVHFKPSLPEMVENFNRILTDYKSWEILPLWVKERAQQHRSYLIKEISNSYTIQLHCLPNGDRVISTNAWDSYDEETKQMIRKGGEIPIKSFWLEHKETCANDGTITRVSVPTDKVYFDSATMK